MIFETIAVCSIGYATLSVLGWLIDSGNALPKSTYFTEYRNYQRKLSNY